jgi:heterodisulfide reductase subunit D
VVKRYPEILPGAEKIKGRHLSEVMAESFKAGKLSSKKGGRVTVSYHDPCYLGRGLGIYDAPREVLRSMEGVELIEMKGNRVDSFCCGARSTGAYFSNFSKRNAKKRLQTFAATGAEVLITSCPYCKEIFQKTLPEKERKRVKDLAEFVDERTE